MFVRSNTGDNNDILLSTLERVHTCNLQLLVDLGVEGTLILHILDQETTLSLVRSDHADLFRFNPGLEELCRDLLDAGRLSPVQEWGSASSDLLLSYNTKWTYKYVFNIFNKYNFIKYRYRLPPTPNPNPIHWYVLKTLILLNKLTFV